MLTISRTRRKKQAVPQRIIIRLDEFPQVAQYLVENQDEKVAIYNLIIKKNEYLSDCGETAYSRMYIKKMEEYFGSDIIMTNINGKTSVVTLRITDTHFLQDFTNSRIVQLTVRRRR